MTLTDRQILLATQIGADVLYERWQAAIAERDALADALRKYGEHRRDCLHRYLRTCDCGFSAALDPNRDTRP